MLPPAAQTRNQNYLPEVTTTEDSYLPQSSFVAPSYTPIQTGNAPAEIKGGPIIPGRIYRLQLGSFKVPRNAVDTFDKLKNAGLNPSWEPFESYYRIVITGIRAEDIPATAARLGNAGFREAVARIEGYED
jgi:rare lipoprotein A